MTLADPKSIHVFGEVGNKHLQTAGDMVEKVAILINHKIQKYYTLNVNC